MAGLLLLRHARRVNGGKIVVAFRIGRAHALTELLLALLHLRVALGFLLLHALHALAKRFAIALLARRSLG